MTGYEALDEYGSWRTVGHYGSVWFPRSVPVGWIPYRDGYWSWVEPWGWNWIDVQPWGFAPFHYGRWAYVDGLWGWAPGDYATYPVYAPGLVGWISDPATIVTAAAVGALTGWFPLGPGEPYWPWYTNDSRYITAVNTGIVADPGNLGARPSGDAASANLNFANRRFATVVPQQVFATAQRVGRAALPVAAAAALHAAVTAQAPQFHPANGHGRPMVVVGTGRRAAAHATTPMMMPGPRAARQSAAAIPRFAQPRQFRHMGAPRMPHFARTHFAAPRMPHVARPHFSAPRMAVPHVAPPH